jgi:hypothetical protein
LQQIKKEEKSNIEAAAESSIALLGKEIIHHRPAPRKMLSAKQKVVNLESCISKIKCPADLHKHSKDPNLTLTKNNHSKVHSNEIKPKADGRKMQKRGRKAKNTKS